MQIATIKIRAKRIKMKRKLTRDMRAIYDGEYAHLTCTANDFLDRKDNGGWRSDMADKNDTRVCVNATPKILNKTFFCFNGNGDGVIYKSKSTLFGKKTPCAIHGTILMIRA